MTYVALSLCYKIGFFIAGIYFLCVFNKRIDDYEGLVITSVAMSLLWPLTLPADLFFNVLNFMKSRKSKKGI